MNYIFESIFVGYFSVFIFLLVHLFIDNIYLTLLITGFAKHQIGYFSGLHTYFCNYGEACLKNNSYKLNPIYKSTRAKLNTESIYESFAYLIFGSMFFCLLNPYKLTNACFVYFMIGIILHILSDKIGIHNEFCNKSCAIDNPYKEK
jgi:hypothetical protein